MERTLAETLQMLRRLAGEEIDLAWRPGRELWPVKIDPTQLDQVLANLVVNARNAISGAGQVTIETRNVTVAAAFCANHTGLVPGDYVRLAVIDDGARMSEEVLARVFEPFFTTKGPGEGTGLGLPAVYGIVKQSNGFVYAYSQPGQGATFSIYLPRVWDAAAPKMATVVTASAGGSETVLLVEDEETVLRLGQAMLEAWATPSWQPRPRARPWSWPRATQGRSIC